MRAVVDSLSTTGESPVAEQILSAWEHDRGSARFLRASANLLFTFTRAKRAYVLRFNHASERSPGGINAEIAYLQHLSAAGVRVARPIPSRSGRYVESVHTAHGTFHAVAFEALAGRHFAIDALTPGMFTRWGQALGQLHRAAQTYSAAGRPTWRDHFAMLADQIPAGERAARDAVDHLYAQVRALPAGERNFGLIHFDFELDNILWDANDPGIIDFDDSAWYWFVADIAFALRDLFEDQVEKIDLSSEPSLTFIAGYRTAKDIAREDLQLIPLFLRVHHAITFAKLLRALEAGGQPDQPAWVAALREKLERKVQSYRDEFATNDS
jgi:Ser/Thr protein kinase RdoA (MazF antagonist)